MKGQRTSVGKVHHRHYGILNSSLILLSVTSKDLYATLKEDTLTLFLISTKQNSHSSTMGWGVYPQLKLVSIIKGLSNKTLNIRLRYLSIQRLEELLIIFI